MLDRILGLMGKQGVQPNGMGYEQDFKKILQIPDSEETDEIGVIPNSPDLNSLKLRGSIHDMVADPAMQGAISKLLNDPKFMGGLMAMIKEKLGGQAV